MTWPEAFALVGIAFVVSLAFWAPPVAFAICAAIDERNARRQAAAKSPTTSGGETR